jgi:hypothetical protein
MSPTGWIVEYWPDVWGFIAALVFLLVLALTRQLFRIEVRNLNTIQSERPVQISRKVARIIAGDLFADGIEKHCKCSAFLVLAQKKSFEI